MKLRESAELITAVSTLPTREDNDEPIVAIEIVVDEWFPGLPGRDILYVEKRLQIRPSFAGSG